MRFLDMTQLLWVCFAAMSSLWNLVPGFLRTGLQASIINNNRSKFIQINTCPFHALKPVNSHEVTSMRNELKLPSLKRAWIDKLGTIIKFYFNHTRERLHFCFPFLLLFEYLETVILEPTHMEITFSGCIWRVLEHCFKSGKLRLTNFGFFSFSQAFFTRFAFLLLFTVFQY